MRRDFLTRASTNSDDQETNAMSLTMAGNEGNSRERGACDSRWWLLVCFNLGCSAGTISGSSGKGKMPTIFSLTPTFTQGLIIGQVSILLLLALILRYLFLEPAVSSRPPSLPALAAAARQRHETSRSTSKEDASEADDPPPAETAEWFNVILQNVSALNSPFNLGIGRELIAAAVDIA